MSKERRKFPRVQFNLPIKISEDECDLVTETKNISGNGAYCTVNDSIELMTRLKVILLVPVRKGGGDRILKKISCNGIVVRKESVKVDGKSVYDIGIFFNEIKDPDKKILVSYVNSALKDPSSQH